MKKSLILPILILYPLIALADDLYVSADNPTAWVKSSESLPEIDKETSVYLGDVMLTQRRGYYQECLKLKINFTKTKAGSNYHIVDGGLICKPSKGSKYYVPDFITVDGDWGSKNMEVVLSEKRGKINYKVNSWNIKTFTHEEFKQSFVPSVRYEIERNSFQQTLEYSGKSGSLLKFIYSEFKDTSVGTLAKFPFTREFTVDLNEGNVGAYKGAVFEVLEATNANIKYKIIRHFPED